jgi:phosphoribosyl 1,2-cyclic phosphodiesterase
MRTDPRFASVRRVFVLLSHAHMDHWEGLKDVEWFWRRGNGLDISLLGTSEALDTVLRQFTEPSYVPLEVLADGTVGAYVKRVLQAGDTVPLGAAELDVFPLHHYSGGGTKIRMLDAVGFHLRCPDGAKISYLSDHEPVVATRVTEDRVVSESNLVVYDAHFANVRDHAFGHGSQEHAADVARRHAGTLVLAGHHGPGFTDEAIRESHRRHSAGAQNFQIAVEGHCYQWRAEAGRFELREAQAGRVAL